MSANKKEQNYTIKASNKSNNNSDNNNNNNNNNNNDNNNNIGEIVMVSFIIYDL